MNSDTEVCNVALTMIGAEKLTSLSDDDSDAAEACRRLYGPIRDEVVSAYFWREARARAALSPLSETPAFEFDYQYLLPADCLRPVELYGSLEVWTIEDRNLLTNETTVNLKYIKKITNVTNFSPELVSAIAARLASDLAVTLSGSKTLAEAMQSIYQIRIGSLVSTNNQGGGTPKQWTADSENWADARLT